MWGSLDIDLDGLDSSDDHRVLVQQYETYTYEYNMNYKSWANVNSDMMTIKEFGLLWDWYRSSLSLDHRKGISIHSLVDECVASNVFQSGENTYEEALKFFNLMDINGSGFISFSELVAMSSPQILTCISSAVTSEPRIERSSSQSFVRVERIK